MRHPRERDISTYIKKPKSTSLARQQVSKYFFFLHTHRLQQNKLPSVASGGGSLPPGASPAGGGWRWYEVENK